MLVLQGLVDRGEVPLLGPRTSIGDVPPRRRLLLPARARRVPLGRGPGRGHDRDRPVRDRRGRRDVVARPARRGGPSPGSPPACSRPSRPAGIEASTFIWNPNLIPLASALAFAAALYAIAVPPRALVAAVRARRDGRDAVPRAGGRRRAAAPRRVAGRRPRAAAPGRAPPAGGRGGRRRRSRSSRPATCRCSPSSSSTTSRRRARSSPTSAGAAAAPRAAPSPGSGSSALRSIAWPVSGLLTDRPLLATVAVIAACALVAIAVLAGRGIGRRARGLARRVRRLGDRRARAVRAEPRRDHARACPNDHYHSFLDPLVLALLGAGIAARRRARRRTRATAALAGSACPPDGTAAAAGVGILLVAVSVVAWPPRRRPTAAGASPTRPRHGRIALARPDDVRPFALVGIPPFKNANAMRFPLEHRGATPLHGATEAAGGGTLVVVCDPLFNDVVGAACGGPAEDALLAARGRLRPRPPRPLRRGFAARDLGLRRRAMTRLSRARRRTTFTGRQFVDASSPNRSTSDVARISRSLRGAISRSRASPSEAPDLTPR